MLSSTRPDVICDSDAIEDPLDTHTTFGTRERRTGAGVRTVSERDVLPCVRAIDLEAGAPESALGPLGSFDGIVVTKHGKPVARVIPANSGCAALIGSMKGKVGVSGDVFSTGIGWNAES